MKTPLGFSFFVALLLPLCPVPRLAASTKKRDAAGRLRPAAGRHFRRRRHLSGPTAPFGMVQLSPDTDRSLCSGYAYSDPTILGFSMTHLSGTGCADLADFFSCRKSARRN